MSTRWALPPVVFFAVCSAGGTKVGNGAWALAWVDTCLDLPGPKDLDPGADERAALMKPSVI